MSYQQFAHLPAMRAPRPDERPSPAVPNPATDDGLVDYDPDSEPQQARTAPPPPAPPRPLSHMLGGAPMRDSMLDHGLGPNSIEVYRRDPQPPTLDLPEAPLFGGLSVRAFTTTGDAGEALLELFTELLERMPEARDAITQTVTTVSDADGVTHPTALRPAWDVVLDLVIAIGAKELLTRLQRSNASTRAAWVAQFELAAAEGPHPSQAFVKSAEEQAAERARIVEAARVQRELEQREAALRAAAEAEIQLELDRDRHRRVEERIAALRRSA